MAVTLEKIYYLAMRKYDMKLIAGRDGIYTNVSWLHIVEETKYAGFLTGGELVLFTGVKIGLSSLPEFLEELRKNEACGLVVNIGEFIREVPQEIIDYCDRTSFPVFTLPWSVRLVELSREFGSMIIRSEEEDKSLCAAFKTAVFHPEEKGEYMPFLEKNDLLTKKYFMIKCLPEIIPSVKSDPDITKTFYELRVIFERILNKYREKFVIFRQDKYLTMIIPEGQRDICEKMIGEILNGHHSVNKLMKLYFAVSRFDLKVEDLSGEYHILSYMFGMMKKENLTIRYRDDLGLLNIILSVEDEKNLIRYKKSAIGKLEKYDEENSTNYVGILRSYLNNDCNMNEAAHEFYLHRNTLAYHLNKISELLGEDLYSMETRAKLLIAIRIKDMLSG
ncbi:MAG: PucR family transcriptional regulator [Lachnospiraceae bacterium]|nr:PucR family transcriptional regulator [Lachnospiraceae bacterium]